VKPVVLHSEATAELEAAFEYYQSRDERLVAALIAEIERATDRIRRHPAVGSPYKDTSFRRCVLRRFPYVIYYLELPDVIWVAAVAHSRRRPDYWQRRFPEGRTDRTD
jgi:toxin ParE1/3/4